MLGLRMCAFAKGMRLGECDAPLARRFMVEGVAEDNLHGFLRHWTCAGRPQERDAGPPTDFPFCSPSCFARMCTAQNVAVKRSRRVLLLSRCKVPGPKCTEPLKTPRVHYSASQRVPKLDRTVGCIEKLLPRGRGLAAPSWGGTPSPMHPKLVLPLSGVFDGQKGSRTKRYDLTAFWRRFLLGSRPYCAEGASPMCQCVLIGR